MIEKIGCLHVCSIAGQRPLDVLESEVQRASADPEYFRDSIIVLPEAFNLIGLYQPKQTYEVEPSRTIKDRLSKLAKQLGALFVVGLIDNDVHDAQVPPLSSSYLIAPATSARLSLKTGADNTARCEVKLYQDSPVEEDTPFFYAGETWVGSLLCMDIDENSSQVRSNIRERHAQLKKRMPTMKTAPVLCIPARTWIMNTHVVERTWAGMHYMLANACEATEARRYPSVLRAFDQEVLEVPAGLRIISADLSDASR